MHQKLVVVALVSLLVGALILFGQVRGLAESANLQSAQTSAEADEKEEDKSFWMEKKLRLSQKVFAGLAEGDFQAIIVSAEAMSALNRIESFTRGRFPGYRAHLRNFTAANRDLIKQAGRENLEGATLAFTQLTFSCVKCHQDLRDGVEEDGEDGDVEEDGEDGDAEDEEATDDE